MVKDDVSYVRSMYLINYTTTEPCSVFVIWVLFSLLFFPYVVCVVVLADFSTSITTITVISSLPPELAGFESVCEECGGLNIVWCSLDQYNVQYNLPQIDIINICACVYIYQIYIESILIIMGATSQLASLFSPE